jgi:uncharacterized protein (DUF736 family)
MQEETLAVLTPSPSRRWFGIVVLLGLSALTVLVAFDTAPAPEWRLFLGAVAVGALWMAEKMRRATMRDIVLTATELREQDGDRLTLMSDVEAIDRGMFAFKPSQGFLLKTKTRGTGAWRPGLWWRSGRRIGVGGVTRAGQAKAMADVITAMIAARAGRPEGDDQGS